MTAMKDGCSYSPLKGNLINQAYYGVKNHKIFIHFDKILAVLGHLEHPSTLTPRRIYTRLALFSVTRTHSIPDGQDLKLRSDTTNLSIDRAWPSGIFMVGRKKVQTALRCDADRLGGV